MAGRELQGDFRPEVPAPTTSTSPSGMSAGLRYWELCSWRMPASSPAAASGSRGSALAPVATMTLRARTVPAVVSTANPAPAGVTPVTRTPVRTGRLKRSA